MAEAEGRAGAPGSARRLFHLSNGGGTWNGHSRPGGTDGAGGAVSVAAGVNIALGNAVVQATATRQPSLLPPGLLSQTIRTARGRRTIPGESATRNRRDDEHEPDDPHRRCRSAQPRRLRGLARVVRASTAACRLGLRSHQGSRGDPHAHRLTATSPSAWISAGTWTRSRAGRRSSRRRAIRDSV